MSLSKYWNEFKSWWKGTTIGEQIDTAGEKALEELETLEPAALETVVVSASTAILTGLASGGSTSAIIAAGIVAAETAFTAQEKQVAATTVTTLVSTLHSSIVAQQANGAVIVPTKAS